MAPESPPHPLHRHSYMCTIEGSGLESGGRPWRGLRERAMCARRFAFLRPPGGPGCVCCWMRSPPRSRRCRTCRARWGWGPGRCCRGRSRRWPRGRRRCSGSWPCGWRRWRPRSPPPTPAGTRCGPGWPVRRRPGCAAPGCSPPPIPRWPRRGAPAGSAPSRSARSATRPRPCRSVRWRGRWWRRCCRTCPAWTPRRPGGWRGTPPTCWPRATPTGARSATTTPGPCPGRRPPAAGSR